MIEFAFCEPAVAPVRREPSDMAEMSAQLILSRCYLNTPEHRFLH
jgi:hypothetical protein